MDSSTGISYTESDSGYETSSTVSRRNVYSPVMTIPSYLQGGKFPLTMSIHLMFRGRVELGEGGEGVEGEKNAECRSECGVRCRLCPGAMSTALLTNYSLCPPLKTNRLQHSPFLQIKLGSIINYCAK